VCPQLISLCSAYAGLMDVTARTMFTEELKAHREKTGLTQEDIAQKANVSLSLLKKIENGRRRPQRDFAVWCDEFFGSPGTFERFHRLTLLETFPEWFASRMVYEEQASVITEWEMRGIPGLLQTRAYAQAMIRACRPFDPEPHVVRDIDSRIERQDILSRDDPPRLWILLAEGALRQIIGDQSVMRSQLDRLIEVAGTTKCVLQVLPYNAAEAPAPGGPASLFEFPDRSPAAYLEGWDVGWLVEDANQVTRISTTLSMIRGCALSPAESRNLMVKIRGEF
jgi:transcriptional regulator with XRE-family HTH domain